MVNKNKMTTAVSELERELSTPPGETPSRPASGDAAEPHNEASADIDANADPQLQDVEHLLAQHGLDADEFKGIWEHFLEELKDMPSKKPLVTVFGAFLLGFIAGRGSRK